MSTEEDEKAGPSGVAGGDESHIPPQVDAPEEDPNSGPETWPEEGPSLSPEEEQRLLKVRTFNSCCSPSSDRHLSQHQQCLHSTSLQVAIVAACRNFSKRCVKLTVITRSIEYWVPSN